MTTQHKKYLARRPERIALKRRKRRAKALATKLRDRKPKQPIVARVPTPYIKPAAASKATKMGLGARIRSFFTRKPTV